MDSFTTLGFVWSTVGEVGGRGYSSGSQWERSQALGVLPGQPGGATASGSAPTALRQPGGAPGQPGGARGSAPVQGSQEGEPGGAPLPRIAGSTRYVLHLCAAVLADRAVRAAPVCCGSREPYLPQYMLHRLRPRHAPFSRSSAVTSRIDRGCYCGRLAPRP